MRNTLAFALLITFLFIGCQSNKDILDNRPAIIRGKVYGESNYVNINFFNILHKRISLTQSINQEDRTFEFIVQPYHAQDADFTYQNTTKRIFISPNDTLYITAKVDSSSQLKLEFEGKTSAINNDMQVYPHPGEKHYAYVDKTDINKLSVRSHLAQLRESINHENELLNEFISTQRPSEEFIDWARQNIIYSNANYLMNYKMILAMNNMPRNDSLFQSDLFPVYNEKGLVSSMYGVHLWHHTTDQYIQTDSLILDFFDKEEYYNGYDATIRRILDQEPQGLIRDIMIFRMITECLKESPGDLDRIRNNYAGAIGNKMLKNELESLSSEMETERSVAYKDTAQKDSSNDMCDYLLEESKKQLLYVDIWATWCEPCRAEMPKLKSLHENLKNENIKIISICCDTKKNDWLAVIEDNHLPGEHFLLNKPEAETLKSYIPHFQGFPTYLIIKNGEIVDPNALRPSSGDKIINKLKSYL